MFDTIKALSIGICLVRIRIKERIIGIVSLKKGADLDCAVKRVCMVP